jgi:hypothetical protein
LLRELSICDAKLVTKGQILKSQVAFLIISVRFKNWARTGCSETEGARMGMEEPKGLTVSGLAAVWAEAQVRDCQKA